MDHHRLLSDESYSMKQWIIFFICAGTLFLAVFVKISFDISINQLKKLLPEAEYKIQRAIVVLEQKQAKRNAESEFARKKKRMQTFRQGTKIDVEENDSKIDQISREQASSEEISDLEEDDKLIFREDTTFKKRFLIEVSQLEKEAKGRYQLGSDMTEEQIKSRTRRIKRLVIQKEKDKKKNEIARKREESQSQLSVGANKRMKKNGSKIIYVRQKSRHTHKGSDENSQTVRNAQVLASDYDFMNENIIPRQSQQSMYDMSENQYLATRQLTIDPPNFQQYCASPEPRNQSVISSIDPSIKEVNTHRPTTNSGQMENFQKRKRLLSPYNNTSAAMKLMAEGTKTTQVRMLQSPISVKNLQTIQYEDNFVMGARDLQEFSIGSRESLKDLPPNWQKQKSFEYSLPNLKSNEKLDVFQKMNTKIEVDPSLKMVIKEDVNEHIQTTQQFGHVDDQKKEKSSPLPKCKSDETTLLDHWLNNYWMLNFTPQYSVKDTDIAVNKLIDYLLTTGEENITGKVQSKHAKKAILMRQNEINAVMSIIKPGLLSIFFKTYKKEMISKYLHKVKVKHLDGHQIVKNIMKDINQSSIEMMGDIENEQKSTKLQKVQPLGISQIISSDKIQCDHKIIQTARDDVKIQQAKKLGLNIEDPKKFQLQIVALGNNVTQIVAQVHETSSCHSHSEKNEINQVVEMTKIKRQDTDTAEIKEKYEKERELKILQKAGARRLSKLTSISPKRLKKLDLKSPQGSIPPTGRDSPKKTARGKTLDASFNRTQTHQHHHHHKKISITIKQKDEVIDDEALLAKIDNNAKYYSNSRMTKEKQPFPKFEVLPTMEDARDTRFDIKLDNIIRVVSPKISSRPKSSDRIRGIAPMAGAQFSGRKRPKIQFGKGEYITQQPTSNSINQSNVSLELLQQFMDNDSIKKDISQYTQSVEVLDMQRHLRRRTNAIKHQQMEIKRNQTKFATIRDQYHKNMGGGPFNFDVELKNNHTQMSRYSNAMDEPILEPYPKNTHGLDHSEIMEQPSKDEKLESGAPSGLGFYFRPGTNMESIMPESEASQLK